MPLNGHYEGFPLDSYEISKSNERKSLITALLYEEIVVEGYTGSQRTLRRQLQAFRQTRERPVSKETIILDNPLSPRGVALLMVRPAQSRTREQTAYLEQLIQSDATVAVVFKLVQDFGFLLRKREGQVHLEQWKASVQASGIAELIAFVDGWDITTIRTNLGHLLRVVANLH